MRDQLPHIEVAYRDWLAENHELLDVFHEHTDLFLYEQGLKELPPQIALPGSIPWSYYNDLLPRINPGVTGKDTDIGWMSATFYANYERTRHTYYVEDELVDLIGDLSFPEGTPASTLLYLPLPCFALEIKGTVYAVFYDLLTGEESSGELEIRTAVLRNRTLYSHAIFHLKEGMTLQEAVESGPTKILQHIEREKAKGADISEHEHGIWVVDRMLSPEDAAEEIKRLGREIANILLYMAGEDDIVERVGHVPPKPFKRHVRKLEGTGHLDKLKQPINQSSVGLRVKQALIRFREDERRKHEESGDKRPFTPRVVPPHPQLYHTGEGRKIPRVRYKGMYFAGGQAERKPTVQRVK